MKPLYNDKVYGVFIHPVFCTCYIEKYKNPHHL